MFEYFLCAYEHNPNIKLIFIDCCQEYYNHFIRAVDDRYNLIGIEGYKENILGITRANICRMKFGRAMIVNDGTIPQIKGILSAKDLIVLSEVFKNQKELILNKDLYNVTYFGEMPFNYYDKQYRMKMLLSRLKPLSKVESAIFVNSPHNHDFSFLDDLILPDKPIIIKDRVHKDNLFELFDTYLYFHANTWFDPHPRLFVECAHYGKEIIYYNKHGIKDGSYYRYNDVLKNGTKDRDLSKDDEIIKRLI